MANMWSNWTQSEERSERGALAHGGCEFEFCAQAGFRIRIHLIRIRIQHLRLETNPDPDPIRIQGFNDQKFKENYSGKKKFLIKNCNLPIPRLP